MKKILVTIAVLALAVCAFAFSAAAATKQDVIAAAKAVIPSEYEYLYLSQAETVLNATDPDADSCAALIDMIEKYADLLENKGPSLSQYTQQEKDEMLQDVDRAASMLGFAYQLEPASNNAGDVKLVITVDGRAIAEFDGDAIQQTGAEESVSPMWAIALGAVVLAAGAAFVFVKKVLA